MPAPQSIAFRHALGGVGMHLAAFSLQWTNEADPQHVVKPSTGTCRVRHCAGKIVRRHGSSRTMATPGNPRAERSGIVLPVSREAAARTIGVVAAPPIDLLATTPMVRRWAAGGGPEGRSRWFRIWWATTGTAVPAPQGSIASGVSCTVKPQRDEIRRARP